MALELWLSFVAASLALLMLPGPTVMLVASYALAHGKRTAWATVPGVALGDFTAMTISLLGAGALLATSATLFTVLKLCGAAYLIWLGIQMWRQGGRSDSALDRVAPATGRRMFLNAYTVTALNPKGVMFFIAFVPQFIDVTQPAFTQFAILEATFVTLASCTVFMWAMLAGSLRSGVGRPEVQRLISKCGGGLLMGAGFLTATVSRSN